MPGTEERGTQEERGSPEEEKRARERVGAASAVHIDDVSGLSQTISHLTHMSTESLCILRKAADYIIDARLADIM